VKTNRQNKRKKKFKDVVSKAKKKTASARAIITEGSGVIKINKRSLKVFQPELIKTYIQEPLVLAGDLAGKYDIVVTVKGGGFMGQAVASRAAIAKALVAKTKSNELRQRFSSYDRMLLVDDYRRKEAKKPLGKKARAKKQTSFR